MVKPENTGKRDLAYSQWHRTLPDHCYMIDIDSIEWRANGGVKALIETAKQVALVYKKKFQLKVLKELAQKIGAKAFLVLYSEELTCFEVYDLTTAEEWCDCQKQILNEQQYRNFIINL